MKINVLIAVIFLSIVVYASTNFLTGVVGATQLNGEGCACHSLEPNNSVNVWIEGPDTVPLGETVQYRVYLTGGPAVKGGFNVAVGLNDISITDASMQEIDDELTHTLPKSFPSVTDTISWLFNFTATAEGWDTLYSVANSVNDNSIPTGDMWNFGEKFPLLVTPPVPVELVSFSAKSDKRGIHLSWSTASEINNNGFEIERSRDNNSFYLIGFVEGNGTTTLQNTYSFSDQPEQNGKYYYRLKQTDFDGSFEYSNTVSVEFNLDTFELSQNYPNPFNPATFISFSIPDEGYLNLKVYDLKGELVEILSDGIISSGSKSIKWNASSHPSGVYFYQLSFESKNGVKFSETKKMILAK